MTPDDPIKEQKTIGVLGDFQLPCLATGEKGSAIVNQLKTTSRQRPITWITNTFINGLVSGKFYRFKPPYLMGKSMVSGVDFPLNQSIEFNNRGQSAQWSGM
jgi:hypothetical protein